MSKYQDRVRKERGRKLLIVALTILIINIATLIILAVLYMAGTIDIRRGKITLKNKEDTNKNTVLTFQMPKENNVPIRAQAVIDHIIKDGMTEYEKVKIIHDWIIEWTHYSNTEADKKGGGTYRTEHGVFVVGQANSEGYARSFRLLCSLAGIQSEVVTGSIGGSAGEKKHSWNTVGVDGRWYIVDTAWDDIEMESVGNREDIVYDLLLVNDDVISKTHTWDKNSCTRTYDTKYIGKGYTSNKTSSSFKMRSIVRGRYNKGGKYITFLYTGTGSPDTIFIGNEYENSTIVTRKVGDYTRVTVNFNRE